MSSSWDDFEGSEKDQGPKKHPSNIIEKNESKESRGTGCDWGFRTGLDTRDDGVDAPLESSSLSKFIEIYECYLEDKHSINQQTENCSAYRNNPQKALQEWFDNEGHEFSIKTEQPRPNQYICNIDLPIEDQDFSITSECCNRKNEATDEVCLAACRMLDECHLLYSWQSAASTVKEDSDRKRRLGEAIKEDDIELDHTCTKRLCDPLRSGSSKSNSNVNTYESLLARWTELNMCIVKLKAQLVRLDLSVANEKAAKTFGSKTNSDGNNDDEEDEEVDPLDEYMSSLETKTKLSMDEKIEKSRIKSQIAAYEREQVEVSRLIELAKPKFNFNKACPPTKANVSSSSLGSSINLKGNGS